MKQTLIALSILPLMSVPAFAGGMTAVEPEPPVVAPMTMAPPSTDWTGGWAGVTLGHGDGNFGAAGGNGAVYGLQGGYDWDFGQWVAGAGLAWDKTNIDLGPGGDSLDSITRLELRVGADLGRTLVYATAGPARASATIGGVGRDDSGWYGGIGADYMLNNRWTIGGEILKNQFDNFDGTGTDLDATTATVNLGLRF